MFAKMNAHPAQQEEAVTLCENGHNLCLTGQAGTGKTFTVKRIVETMEAMGMAVTITCTTGMACMQYQQAHTIHSWAGLQDGRYSTEQLIHLLQNNEKFTQCRQNIISTDYLVIDEISMLSRVLFEQLEAVCRAVRKTPTVFGAIQVVAVGDFFQLQPVPSRYGDAGEMCIKSAVWDTVFPHHIFLREVIRQTEGRLIKAVCELAKGCPSPATNNFILELSRPLPAEKNCVKLFSRNLDVDFENDQMLAKAEGESFTYEAIDSGNLSMLGKSKVQKKIILKKGAPVVLMTNLTSPLMNGLQGKVIDLDTSGPLVDFPSVGITKKMERFSFSVYDREKQVDVASRVQFPLKLGFAITIHRSQGMTLDSVEVDCRGSWKPGQIAVAIGRVTSSDGLRVVNYHPALAPEPEEAIQKFYEKTNGIVNPVLGMPASSCCRTIPVNPVPVSEGQTDPDSEYSDFDEEELWETDKLFNSLDAAVCVDLPPCETQEIPESSETCPSTSSPSITRSTLPEGTFQPISMVQSMRYSSPVTKEQANMNDVINSVLEKKEFEESAHIIWDEISTLYQKSIGTFRGEQPKTLSTKELNKFNAGLFDLINGETIKGIFQTLFSSFTDDEKTFSSRFTLSTAKQFLTWKASLITTTEPSTATVVKQMSTDGLGKVRYVGGMCVAKLKFKYTKTYHNNAHSKLQKKKELVNKCTQSIRMLQTMECSYAELSQSTKYPQSLTHTQRKQNERCSLTNISDKSLEFFLELETQRILLSTKQAANQRRQHVLTHVTEQISAASKLKEKFLCAIGMSESQEDIKGELYSALIEKYMNVGHNQFRKELLSLFSKKKTLAHRVHIATQKKEIKDQKADVTASEDTKGEAVKNIQVGKGKHKVTKQKLVDPEEVMTKPGKRKGNGKGKSTKKQRREMEEGLIFCPKCGMLHEEHQDWISCGKCNDWYNRQSSGVGSDTEWDILCTTEKLWFCSNCLTF